MKRQLIIEFDDAVFERHRITQDAITDEYIHDLFIGSALQEASDAYFVYAAEQGVKHPTAKALLRRKEFIEDLTRGSVTSITLSSSADYVFPPAFPRNDKSFRYAGRTFASFLDSYEQIALVLSQLTPELLTFDYINYKDEMSTRRVIFDKFEYRESEWHGTSWHLDGFDVDKQAPRSFAVRAIFPLGHSTIGE